MPLFLKNILCMKEKTQPYYYLDTMIEKYKIV